MRHTGSHAVGLVVDPSKSRCSSEKTCFSRSRPDEMPPLDAVRQVARTGTDAQRAAAAEILSDARRSLYVLLADAPDAPEA